MGSPPSTHSRVSAACQRCRKQKLRCELEKPCTSCIRSGVDCVPRLAQRTHRKKPQTRSISNENSFQGTATSTSAAKEYLPSPRTLSADPSGGASRYSWLGVAKDLLKGGETIQQSERRPTHALPWAPDVVPGPRKHGFLTIEEVVTIKLPTKDVLDSLLDTYFFRTQWFMLIFHEPSFREKYERIFGTGVLEPSEANFLRLCLVLFSIGARFSAIVTTSVSVAMELERLRKSLTTYIESAFIPILEVADLCAVQICLLVGSYMTYEGRLSCGFAVVGSGVAVAREMGLSNENTWKGFSPEVWEERKRTWWALEIVDKFDAVKSGRAPGISGFKVEVSYPEDLGDLTAPPDLPSLLEYHHAKFTMYRILSPALLDHTVALSPRLLKSITLRIQEWESKLPHHLQWGCIEELRSSDQTTERQKYVEQLRLQALALHISFSSLKIIFYRPFVFTSALEDESQAHATQARASRLAIFETALRISNISTRFPLAAEDVLLTTHAATLCGITMFTAGIVLGCIALSNPLSSEAETAKNGISRIVAMQSIQKARHILLSPQSACVLEDLVRLIALKQTAVSSRPQNQNRIETESRGLAPAAIQAPNFDESWKTSLPDLTSNAPFETVPAPLFTSNQNYSYPYQYVTDYGAVTDTDFVLSDNQTYSEGLNDVWQVLMDRNAMSDSLSFLFSDCMPT